MNPTTWNIAQAYLSQSEVGWNCFFKGIIVKEWSRIQMKHYEKEAKDGENIHRWKRIVVQSIMDLIRELWSVRCGYIHAETTMTATQILRQRTKQLHDDNINMRDRISVMDRHLIEKKDSYFWKWQLR